MIDFVDLFNACLYIQDNLDTDLSLLFLAQTVGLSRFRFHRVFKAWRGETLHDFVTRMRMERAAFELRYPIPHSSRRSIKSIAFASGYKSLSSFSHAFSSYAQVSPREFRNQALRTKPVAAEPDRIAGAFAPFSIEVTEQPERQIAVLETVTVAPPGGRPAIAEGHDGHAIEGDRFGVELLPHLLARSRASKHVPGKFRHLGCVGVELRDWQEQRLRRSPFATQFDPARRGPLRGLGRSWVAVDAVPGLAARIRSLARGHRRMSEAGSPVRPLRSGRCRHRWDTQASGASRCSSRSKSPRPQHGARAPAHRASYRTLPAPACNSAPEELPSDDFRSA